MVIYIWLLIHEIIIQCTTGVGCIQSSMAHFNYIIGLGALEMIFEIPGIVRIFFKKDDINGKK